METILCRNCHKKPSTIDGLCHRCWDILTEILTGSLKDSYHDSHPTTH